MTALHVRRDETRLDEKETIKGCISPMPAEKITSAKNIEDLPDDALFEIFNTLDCTEILNASSVCRRWQRLASHYSVWAQRHIKATDIGGRKDLETLVTTIPVVHTLDFTRTCVEESTLQAILKSSIRVRNLKLCDCTIEPRAVSSVNPVLRHLSQNLEGLSIHLHNSIMHNSNEFTLSDMVNLRSLALIGDDILDFDKLQKFKLDCPSFKSLDLSRFNSRTYSYSEPRRYSFISSLINDAQRNLKAVYLPTICNREILSSVKQCDQLTTISLQLEYVAVVSYLPLIQTLILHCDSCVDPPSTWIRPSHLRELVLHLRRPKDVSVNFLKSIKAPSLTLISDNLCKEVDQFCSDSVQRLILRCHFLRLRHVSVIITREATMPRLKFLDVRKCFLGRGVPPRILGQLKGRFPCLTVRSDKFVGYRKQRELRDNVDCVLHEETDCSDTE